MSLPRRISPAVVVNTALATTLLAVLAAGDAGPLGLTPDDVGSSLGAADPAAPGPVWERAGAAPRSLQPPDGATALLTEAVAPLIAEGDTRLSVAVVSLETGASAAYGDDLYDTASIAKVDILAVLLLQAQDEGRQLTQAERQSAEVMIQRSDNAAADELWRSIGGAPGLDAANERLGLTETTGGPDGHWGLTQTTSADQIALLRVVYGDDSPLDAASRSYIRELMAGVVPGQRWGISAAADEAFELKNGWLPRTRTGLWDVNSIGRVTSGGEEYLVAVVSDGHLTHADGIAVVETAAVAAVDALSTGARTGQRPGV
ncbi:serine hydrolase [Streptomyces sp. NBC_01803]|uniref:serine hydrolase n=1 Tax=Streptomyces sp. NBC_01803 TaxID=2975946 RepID=UPI002DD88989|nr:serine hydrolase [Streptomyces sp. NBC_01803]WSA47075.1 class A beta-lactamase-related serine hydrolase [Streptomyces sp. NBC_01803]